MSTNEQAVNQQQEAQQEQTEEHPLYKEMKEFFDRIRKEYFQEGAKCGLILSLVTETDEQTLNNKHDNVIGVIGSNKAIRQAAIHMLNHRVCGGVICDAQLAHILQKMEVKNHEQS